jgi:hypothetical protein
MPTSQLRVGNIPAASLPDNQLQDALAGQSGEQVFAELHGKYYTMTKRGNLYFGASASGGIALIVPATTGGHPTLWNPTGSGYNAVLVRLQLSYVSGANAPTAIEWALTQNAGSSIGSAAPVVTFTNVAPTNSKLGAGNVSAMKWAPTVNTFAVAPPYLCPTGIALDTMAAASTNAPFITVIDYDGTMVLTPGNALSLCTQAATTTALFQVALFWYEQPI